MNSNLINTSINNTYSHTNHSNKRSKQRGVKNESIVFILENATPIYKQGFCFYSLKNNGKKEVPKSLKRDSLMNLVVMTSGGGEAIITVYKNLKAWKNIKRKHKYLS
ncbi:hypothetical protein H0I29_01280 [Polaribacter sp. R2A056_3_33]|uniref:hypothetical protein n=1 Tax=Polaribacter sp. R2A056_3_33 TaxID=2745563 RepID=UPI001C4FB580|nr:hypothetical protein [Polaribacter sp. R2A056_3_33]QXP70757.1 hypothetical protein H0I29_01280 [Polaribacter sp. R2A056_3_33]